VSDVTTIRRELPSAISAAGRWNLDVDGQVIRTLLPTTLNPALASYTASPGNKQAIERDSSSAASEAGLQEALMSIEYSKRPSLRAKRKGSYASSAMGGNCCVADNCRRPKGMNDGFATAVERKNCVERPPETV
jgi:hypothetical protein